MNNILITGISGGIGKAVAKKLINTGSSVIGLTRTVTDEIKEMEKNNTSQLTIIEADVMNVETLGDTVKKMVSDFGPIGGLVHCAGFDKMAPLHLSKASDIESLWRIHALVPMLLIGAISKKRNHSDDTSIVLITSQSAHEGAMGHTAYAAAKGAIEGYLAPAAAELMEKGIRINEVCFGPVKTSMATGWMEKLDEAGMTKLLASYPLGIGEAEDAANLICFLLGKEARWINGQIITADGGHAVRKI